MGASLVVPLDPATDLPPCFLEDPRITQPDAFFPQTTEKPFDHPVLFRRERGHEFLGQFVSQCISRNLRLWNSSPLSLLITCLCRSLFKVPKRSPNRLLLGLSRLPSPVPEGKLIPDSAPAVAIHQSHQVSHIRLFRSEYG